MGAEQVSLPGNTVFSWKGTDPWKDTPDDKLQYSWRLDGGVDSTENNPQYEVNLSWNQGGSWSNARLANLSGTVIPSYSVLGGQSDLWGTHSWSVADFSNTNFRVLLNIY